MQREARQNAAANVIDHDEQEDQSAKEVEFEQTGRGLLHYVLPKRVLLAGAISYVIIS
jgi:hypothetical protein